ncbi:E3 ubiquitin-protein ligase PUB23-like [Coffea eugenioides]|uniref:E3 ubiquitin-protein ligase PUB23-like n=1 Tax=Coffea eugenioides TaxID=49369 RepID=UPI000F612C67|nr:E3 ubiquitin-protein ligase PUB23-like [Coffea eugenioides]
MDEIEIPSHFLCPISMQLMRDPVIVATGMTYDRESIEKWLFTCKNSTCPMTKQELQSTDLTPNHNLRRLIQAWCTLNSSNGIERIPTPKPPVEKSQILKLINEAKNSTNTQIKCLQRLRSISEGSQSNRKSLEAAGAVEFLASIIEKNDEACDEALNLLYHLDASDADLKKLMSDDGNFAETLMPVLKCGSCQSRAYAIMMLKSAFRMADPVQLMTAKPEIFIEIVHILKDQISQQASKAALKLLMDLCPWGRNRIKAIEAGAVLVLIELLLDSSERRASELILTLLDQLCRTADGRAELLKHGAGLAIVSKKIFRVSQVASDRAVRILFSICKYSPTSRVLQEMLQVGVVAKLCLVLQVENNQKTIARAKEILYLHARIWKDSPCIPPSLLSSYPA